MRLNTLAEAGLVSGFTRHLMANNNQRQLPADAGLLIAWLTTREDGLELIQRTLKAAAESSDPQYVNEEWIVLVLDQLGIRDPGLRRRLVSAFVVNEAIDWGGAWDNVKTAFKNTVDDVRTSITDPEYHNYKQNERQATGENARRAHGVILAILDFARKQMSVNEHGKAVRTAWEAYENKDWYVKQFVKRFNLIEKLGVGAVFFIEVAGSIEGRYPKLGPAVEARGLGNLEEAAAFVLRSADGGPVLSALQSSYNTFAGPTDYPAYMKAIGQTAKLLAGEVKKRGVTRSPHAPPPPPKKKLSPFEIDMSDV